MDRIDEALIEKFVQLRRKQATYPNREKCRNCKAVSPAQSTEPWRHCAGPCGSPRNGRTSTAFPEYGCCPGERNRDFVLQKCDESTYQDACREPLKDVALLIFDTGLRVGEALRLEWRDVHLQPIRGGSKLGYIQIRHGKSTNAKRVISLTQRVIAVLKARNGQRVDEFVFSNGEGKSYGESHIAHLHQKVREKLKWSKEFVVHGLRHTMLTRLGEAGVDAFTIMRIAGHRAGT